jgi:hypothetical protein
MNQRAGVTQASRRGIRLDRENIVADMTTEALTIPAALRQTGGMSGRVALMFLAAGAVGTVAWCGLIAYGTVRLFI